MANNQNQQNQNPNKNQQQAGNFGNPNQQGQNNQPNKQQPAGPQRNVGDDLRKYPQGEPGDKSNKPSQQQR
jgi:hypothetical protein